ncbi:hypothetical protein COX93_02305 [Candidatus Nomurabacteria bacterium CG_4_10_14_0_2_um_filter_30_12]|uniref:Uncharacterized protein n=2 Tax=Candidatus Nomuraibacteriota TaxID=1752729 RepID=A0A1J4UX47_9BACT|nr:MAG: hypothetical protein AUJ22_01355 [Candidatus Nomurabacteria bacterium CG1_02_31_12]PIZ87062.1 MAG: hypothetical protein COX93_02305 [Candidatus Nomurabacteria bacterium CG_4_10_14_0_2_um_filter_30_12]
MKQPNMEKPKNVNNEEPKKDILDQFGKPIKKENYNDSENINKLKILKDKINDLNEKYISEVQREEKALLYSQLEEAQKEYRKLEEELDITSSEKKKKPENEKIKTPEEINARKKFTILLERIKSGDTVAIELLLVFITNQTEWKTEWLTPEEIDFQTKLIVLLEEARGGDVAKIEILIKFITTQTIWIILPTSPENIPPTPPTPENIPPKPESSILPLEESRDLYLKAKRLRGNVFRGKFGKLFGRKLNFGEEEIDFGGKDGALELEKVRVEYEKGLSKYRTTELKKFEDSLKERLANGERTPEKIKAEMQTKIVDLLTEEQKNIDEKSTNGIEKNIFEKMKTKWRQHTWSRIGIGVGLGIAAASGIGGAAVIGARAGMGAVGTYVGVESGLERWSKSIGHKSELMTQLSKLRKGSEKFAATDESYKTFLSQLPPEEIKKEATRLRMLQVEKGISIDKLAVSGDNGKMAAIIIAMDNELTAKEVINATNTENPNLAFADVLSKRLSQEVDSRNEAVESEVDKERLKKMARKTTAVLAGGAVGWIIGGKLLQHPDAVTPANPVTPPSSPGVLPPHEFHTVTSGENVWKIIEHDLDSHKTMAGLGSGARTYTIDALKDHFAAMPKEDLIKLGFKSGNINLINPGDTLDMSGILNTDNILHALSGAKNLTPDQVSSIVSNNAKIASWYAEHHQELSASGKIFDSSVIDKILHGINPLSEHSGVMPHDGAGIGGGKEILNHIDNIGQAVNGNHINVLEYGDNSGTGPGKGILETGQESTIKHLGTTYETPDGSSFQSVQQHVQDVYEKNINHMFPKDPISNWLEKGGLSASDVLKQQQPGQLTELSNYLHKLEEVTGLKPKGGSFFKSSETVHRFVNRGIQKAAKLGKLEDLRLE